MSSALKWCALTPSFPIWARTSLHGPGMSLKKLTKPGISIILFSNDLLLDKTAEFITYHFVFLVLLTSPATCTVQFQCSSLYKPRSFFVSGTLSLIFLYTRSALYCYCRRTKRSKRRQREDAKTEESIWCYIEFYNPPRFLLNHRSVVQWLTVKKWMPSEWQAWHGVYHNGVVPPQQPNHKEKSRYYVWFFYCGCFFCYTLKAIYTSEIEKKSQHFAPVFSSCVFLFLSFFLTN